MAFRNCASWAMLCLNTIRSLFGYFPLFAPRTDSFIPSISSRASDLRRKDHTGGLDVVERGGFTLVAFEARERRVLSPHYRARLASPPCQMLRLALPQPHAGPPPSLAMNSDAEPPDCAPAQCL